MTPFSDPEDAALVSELRECGLLTPSAAERIDAALGRAEAMTLNRFLLGGRDILDAQAWISWLVRRQDCFRFGPVHWHEHCVGRAPPDLSLEPNLPYRFSADGRPLVAVLRPDRRTATLRRLGAPVALWAAATLGELADLREAWQRAQRWNFDD